MPFPKTKQELIDSGYVFDRLDRCRGENCRAVIEFWKTKNNKLMPFDPPEGPDFKMVVHWETCPDRDNFRKQKPITPPARMAKNPEADVINLDKILQEIESLKTRVLALEESPGAQLSAGGPGPAITIQFEGGAGLVYIDKISALSYSANRAYQTKIHLIGGAGILVNEQFEKLKKRITAAQNGGENGT